VSYAAADARQQILDEIAAAGAQIALALACLGEAYEVLDEHSADRMEDQLFRPAQQALARAQRTHTDFAAAHGLAQQSFAAGDVGHGNQTGHDLVVRAATAAGEADQLLAELQDSMLPVDVGDPALRAGLAAVRELISSVPPRANDFLRTLGR
jgi:hypothetical protein